MTCENLHPLIGALADGNLVDEAVSAHMLNCAEARRMFDETRAMRAALAHVVLPDAPEARAMLARVGPPAARPRWPLAAAAAALFAAVFWVTLSSRPLPAEVRVAASRFDEPAFERIADLASAHRFVRNAFHTDMPMPDICGIEGCSHPGAGELPPMVFYREGDKRVGLTIGSGRFPDVPLTQDIDGLKCAVIEHEGKTIIVCGSESGYHIWIARMPVAELSEIVHRIPRKTAPAGTLRFTVSPMG
jgi:hypothetical protein